MNGPALLALQLIDADLDQFPGRRQRLPEVAALAAAHQASVAIAAQQAAQRAIVAETAAAIEGCEHQGAEIARHKNRLDAQLKTVIAPREAEALMHEIATLDGKRSELDDVELASMEQQGAAEQALAELEVEAGEAGERTAAAQADADVALAALAAEEATVRARRADADAVLNDAERAYYLAARKRHGGIGVCKVEGRTCSGCHVDISPGELDAMRLAPADELPECPNCARSLVR